MAPGRLALGRPLIDRLEKKMIIDDWPSEPRPDYERLLRALRRRGDPDHVPLLELFADPEVIAAVLHEPVISWGAQRNVMIRPTLWDEFFAPRYERIFDPMHAAGWHVWMHSCGKINALLGRLIDLGVDVINLQQPRALGIEEIGREFRGRIFFESLCDIQHTLPFKGAEAIRQEARLLLDQWTTPDGGFTLSDYGDGWAIGVELEKKQIMLEAFQEADPWRAEREAFPVGVQ